MEDKNLEEFIDKVEEDLKEQGEEVSRNDIRLLIADNLHAVGEGLD